MPHLSPIKTRQHAQALKERDQFLSDHPELRDLQKVIDERLEKASSDHNRLIVIHDLMMDALRRLDEKLQSLVCSRST